ncbi:hypothetical protein LCGC14_0289370 [marine sediment metagenome]|uniref:Uncharacterized protein n=1 Tax=marine sediment metagenome TaxID=412755 RepID=A0A0F9TTV1_9ZZZZ
MVAASVFIKSHQLKGQVCQQTPAGGGEMCGLPATRIGFGVRIESGNPTDMVSFTFSCGECTPESEKCSECPHTSESERFAQLMRAVLDIGVEGVWPIFDVAEHTVLLTFKNPHMEA